MLDPGIQPCYSGAMLNLMRKFSVAARDLEPTPIVQDQPTPNIQGYVDERSIRHVAGWIRNTNDPTERVDFDVAIVSPEETRILATGRADLPDLALQKLEVGDGQYGFRVEFATPLTPQERDCVVVRSVHSPLPIEMAPQIQGFVDERSIHHISGWIRNRSDPDERVDFEIVLKIEAGERILAKGRAAEYRPVLAQLEIGDAAYGFRVLFAEPLTEHDRDQVVVRAVGTQTVLALAPELSTVFEPVSHIAMDIVNNCNLRCPFCVYDYSDTRRTQLMSDSTFESALRLIPYVTDGNFWLSCEHEATMHPALMQFIEKIPLKWRRKVMYTTNLARPMPDDYFDFLAKSGVHHINISLESLDPDLYERMRKGARWRIFSKNWDRLIGAFGRVPTPPRLRYNIMAYRSNLSEIPRLVDHLRNERVASQVEIRHTFEVEHIATEFREAEFLDNADWEWLAQQLASFPDDEVLLIPPPRPVVSHVARSGVSAETGSPSFIPRPLNLRLQYDGKLIVYGEWPGPDGLPEHEQFVVTNVHYLRNPREFLLSL